MDLSDGDPDLDHDDDTTLPDSFFSSLTQATQKHNPPQKTLPTTKSISAGPARPFLEWEEWHLYSTLDKLGDAQDPIVNRFKRSLAVREIKRHSKVPGVAPFDIETWVVDHKNQLPLKKQKSVTYFSKKRIAAFLNTVPNLVAPADVPESLQGLTPTVAPPRQITTPVKKREKATPAATAPAPVAVAPAPMAPHPAAQWSPRGGGFPMHPGMAGMTPYGQPNYQMPYGYYPGVRPPFPGMMNPMAMAGMVPPMVPGAPYMNPMAMAGMAHLAGGVLPQGYGAQPLAPQATTPAAGAPQPSTLPPPPLNTPPPLNQSSGGFPAGTAPLNQSTGVSAPGTPLNQSTGGFPAGAASPALNQSSGMLQPSSLVNLTTPPINPPSPMNLMTQPPINMQQSPLLPQSHVQHPLAHQALAHQMLQAQQQQPTLTAQPIIQPATQPPVTQPVTQQPPVTTPQTTQTKPKATPPPAKSKAATKSSGNDAKAHPSSPKPSAALKPPTTPKPTTPKPKNEPQPRANTRGGEPPASSQESHQANGQKNFSQEVEKFLLKTIQSKETAEHIQSFYETNPNFLPTFAESLVGRNPKFYEVTSFKSPYTNRTLKPFIRQDTSIATKKMLIIHELKLYNQRRDYRKKPPTLPSIDYVYLQPALLGQVNQLLSAEFWPGIDVSESLVDPEHTVVVLLGRMVIACGFITITGYVTYICVRDEFRGLGIAQFMLYHLAQTCPDRDVTLHVSVSNTAMLLYNKFGFKIEEFIVNFYDQYMPDNGPQSKNAYLLRLRR